MDEFIQRMCQLEGAQVGIVLASGMSAEFTALTGLLNSATPLGFYHPHQPHGSRTRAVYITPGLIRISVGLEAGEDVMADVGQALGRRKLSMANSQSSIVNGCALRLTAYS
ncbi:MAG: PLP-dependent transferase [Chloroflexi bacterium]|nr:PLP-dependent transferase [Chloroflexota bacterium]